MAMAPVIIQPPGDGNGPRNGPRPFDPPVIVPAPPQDIQDADAPFVTQWGTDPAFVGDSIASPFTPLPRHFPNARSTEFELLDDAFTVGDQKIYQYAHATFDVTFEPPDPSDPSRSADAGRDPHNGRWYCDIDIDAGTPYFPFLHLRWSVSSLAANFQIEGSSPTTCASRPSRLSTSCNSRRSVR